MIVNLDTQESLAKIKMNVNGYFLFKVAVLGAQGAGKTSLINRLVDDVFDRHVKPSEGNFLLIY